MIQIFKVVGTLDIYKYVQGSGASKELGDFGESLWFYLRIITILMGNAWKYYD